MNESRTVVGEAQRLRDEMRALRLQLNAGLSAVRESAFALAANAKRPAPLALSIQTVEFVLPDVPITALETTREGQVPEAALPAPKPLDPKDQTALALLTPREIEVLRLIGEGYRTKEIAFTLGITFKTAVTHRSNIMEKLGIHEGPRLVRFAIRTGIATA